MHANNVIVSVHDDYGMWKYVQSGLVRRLPLRDLQWTGDDGQHCIGKLDLSVMPHDDARLQIPNLPMNWYKKPFVQLYVVHCDDADTYRHVVKARIAQWLDSVDSQWIVLYVAKPRRKFAVRGMTKSIFDRIRADFGYNRKECFCSIPMPNPDSKDTSVEERSWMEFMLRLKDCIGTSFSDVVSRYVTELKRLKTRSNLPGWNFNQFFIIKEGLSFVYERAGRIKDALMVYEELDALLSSLVRARIRSQQRERKRHKHHSPSGSPKQSRSARSSPPSQRVIKRHSLDSSRPASDPRPPKHCEDEAGDMGDGTNRHPMRTLSALSAFSSSALGLLHFEDFLDAEVAPEDANAPLVDILNKKPDLRDRIYRSTISEFYFRLYVFARKAALLFQLTDGAEQVAGAAFAFVRRMYSDLGHYVNHAPPHFRESWAFTACLDAVLCCDRCGAQPTAPDAITRYNSLVADLCYLARQMLDVLGRHMGHLPAGVDARQPVPSKGELLAAPPAHLRAREGGAEDSVIVPWNEPLSDRDTPVSLGAQSVVRSVLASDEAVAQLLSQQAAFDAVYIDLTRSAARRYATAGRLGASLRMRGEEGELCYYRRQWAAAATILSDVVHEYRSRGWESLSYALHYKLAAVQCHLEQWPAYLHSCLAFACPDAAASSSDWDAFGVPAAARVWYLTQLCERAVTLESPVSLPQLQLLVRPTGLVVAQLQETGNACRGDGVAGSAETPKGKGEADAFVIASDASVGDGHGGDSGVNDSFEPQPTCGYQRLPVCDFSRFASGQRVCASVHLMSNLTKCVEVDSVRTHWQLTLDEDPGQGGDDGDDASPAEHTFVNIDSTLHHLVMESGRVTLSPGRVNVVSMQPVTVRGCGTWTCSHLSICMGELSLTMSIAPGGGGGGDGEGPRHVSGGSHLHSAATVSPLQDAAHAAQHEFASKHDPFWVPFVPRELRNGSSFQVYSQGPRAAMHADVFPLMLLPPHGGAKEESGEALSWPRQCLRVRVRAQGSHLRLREDTVIRVSGTCVGGAVARDNSDAVRVPVWSSCMHASSQHAPAEAPQWVEATVLRNPGRQLGTDEHTAEVEVPLNRLHTGGLEKVRDGDSIIAWVPLHPPMLNTSARVHPGHITGVRDASSSASASDAKEDSIRVTEDVVHVSFHVVNGSGEEWILRRRVCFVWQDALRVSGHLFTVEERADVARLWLRLMAANATSLPLRIHSQRLTLLPGSTSTATYEVVDDKGSGACDEHAMTLLPNENGVPGDTHVSQLASVFRLTQVPPRPRSLPEVQHVTKGLEAHDAAAPMVPLNGYPVSDAGHEPVVGVWEAVVSVASPVGAESNEPLLPRSEQSSAEMQSSDGGCRWRLAWRVTLPQPARVWPTPRWRIRVCCGTRQAVAGLPLPIVVRVAPHPPGEQPQRDTATAPRLRVPPSKDWAVLGHHHVGVNGGGEATVKLSLLAKRSGVLSVPRIHLDGVAWVDVTWCCPVDDTRVELVSKLDVLQPEHVASSTIQLVGDAAAAVESVMVGGDGEGEAVT